MFQEKGDELRRDAQILCCVRCKKGLTRTNEDNEVGILRDYGQDLDVLLMLSGSINLGQAESCLKTRLKIAYISDESSRL